MSEITRPEYKLWTYNGDESNVTENVVDWQNGTTPLSAENLNKMQYGFSTVDTLLKKLNDWVSGTDSEVITINTRVTDVEKAVKADIQKGTRLNHVDFSGGTLTLTFVSSKNTSSTE